MTKKMIRVKCGSTPELKSYRTHYGGYGKDDGEKVLVYKGWGVSLYVESSLDSILEQLKDAKKEYGKTYSDLEFQSSRECGCYHDCSCSPTYVLYGKRLETDLEYNFRLDQEKKKADEQKARELAELERLKAKYNPST